MTMLAGKIWSRLSLNINNRKLGALWGTHCKIRSCRFCTEVVFVQFASSDDQWVHCTKLHCVNCITLVCCVYCTVQFALHWMSVYIALNCNVYIALVPRAFSSDPPSPPSGEHLSPPPPILLDTYCPLPFHIHSQQWTIPIQSPRKAAEISNSYSTLFKCGLPSTSQGSLKIIFHFLEISDIVEDEKSLQVTVLYGSLTR